MRLAASPDLGGVAWLTEVGCISVVVPVIVELVARIDASLLLGLDIFPRLNLWVRLAASPDLSGVAWLTETGFNSVVVPVIVDLVARIDASLLLGLDISPWLNVWVGLAASPDLSCDAWLTETGCNSVVVPVIVELVARTVASLLLGLDIFPRLNLWVGLAVSPDLS